MSKSTFLVMPGDFTQPTWARSSQTCIGPVPWNYGTVSLSTSLLAKKRIFHEISLWKIALKTMNHHHIACCIWIIMINYVYMVSPVYPHVVNSIVNHPPKRPPSWHVKIIPKWLGLPHRAPGLWSLIPNNPRPNQNQRRFWYSYQRSFLK